MHNFLVLKISNIKIIIVEDKGVFNRMAQRVIIFVHKFLKSKISIIKILISNLPNNVIQWIVCLVS